MKKNLVVVGRGWAGEDSSALSKWDDCFKNIETLDFCLPKYALFLQDEFLFRQNLFSELDKLFAGLAIFPNKFYLLCQNFVANEAECLDKILAFVLDYYALKKQKKPKTYILGSKYFEYQHAGFINFTHQYLSQYEENLWYQNEKLQKKSVLALNLGFGLNWQKCELLAQKIDVSDECAKFLNKKTVMFVLGENTNQYKVKFDAADALRMADRALDFVQMGYQVVFINSAQTPNDVTDFICDFCLRNNMFFYNRKKLLKTEVLDEAQTYYQGLFYEKFEKEQMCFEYIYYALLLNLKNGGVFVGTAGDFSYLTDAANLGIATAVYAEQNIDKSRADCFRLYDIALKNKYIFDFYDDAVLDSFSHSSGFLAQEMPIRK